MESSERKSIDDVGDQIRLVERSQAAPWTDYPPTPRWYAPVVAVWAASVALAITHLGSWEGRAALVALIAAELAFVAWYRTYRGTTPSGRPPREIGREVWLFLVAVLMLLLGSAAVDRVFGSLATAVLVLVGTYSLVSSYEARYGRAAAVVRRRLS